MNEYLFSAVVFVLCSIGYYFSWRYYSKQNFKIAVLFLIFAGFILRFYTASDLFLHPWDERFHALVAKNLILHPLTPTLYENPILPYDYKSWTANHIWLHKQPLPLWTMAASMWIFGVNEIALRFPSIILSSIGIGLTFIIGKYFFSKKNRLFICFFIFYKWFDYRINGW